MEYNEESNESTMMEDSEPSKAKQWFQDNLRIIISVIIVVLIAGGIYSYSRRSETPIATEQQSEQSGLVQNIAGTEDNKATETPTTTQEGTTGESDIKAQPQDNTSSVATSQETENSFVETAAKGDSHTKLARRALANYLEKNPDSSLTAEHKIYVEDYLRRRVANQGKVSIGTSVEFSKGMIQEAISQSKNLNQSQLNNLHKYAVRVPSLS